MTKTISAMALLATIATLAVLGCEIPTNISSTSQPAASRGDVVFPNTLSTYGQETRQEVAHTLEREYANTNIIVGLADMILVSAGYKGLEDTYISWVSLEHLQAECSNRLAAIAGCAVTGGNRIWLRDDLKPEAMLETLFHEYYHNMGVESEALADAFAEDMMELVGKWLGGEKKVEFPTPAPVATATPTPTPDPTATPSPFPTPTPTLAAAESQWLYMPWAGMSGDIYANGKWTNIRESAIAAYGVQAISCPGNPYLTPETVPLYDEYHFTLHTALYYPPGSGWGGEWQGEYGLKESSNPWQYIGKMTKEELFANPLPPASTYVVPKDWKDYDWSTHNYDWNAHVGRDGTGCLHWSMPLREIRGYPDSDRYKAVRGKPFLAASGWQAHEVYPVAVTAFIFVHIEDPREAVAHLGENQEHRWPETAVNYFTITFGDVVYSANKHIRDSQVEALRKYSHSQSWSR